MPHLLHWHVAMRLSLVFFRCVETLMMRSACVTWWCVYPQPAKFLGTFFTGTKGPLCLSPCYCVFIHEICVYRYFLLVHLHWDMGSNWSCWIWNYLGDIMVALFSFHWFFIVWDLVGYMSEVTPGRRLSWCSIFQRSVHCGEGRVMHRLRDFTRILLGFCDGFSSDCVHWGDLV